MVRICPVSVRRINENLSRLNAAFTVIMSVMFFLTGSPVFPLVVSADFILRNIFEGKLNPVSRFNNYIIALINIPFHPINAGPKIFAARIGLLLSLAGAVLLLTGNTMASFLVFGILALFAFLESAFNFCVACKIYPYVLPLNKFFE